MPLSAAPVPQSGGPVRVRVQRLAGFLLGDGPYARAFENLILGLIVLSVVSVGVEAIPRLPAWARPVLRVEEIVVVIVFSFEYLLRLAAAEKKLAFILASMAWWICWRLRRSFWPESIPVTCGSCASCACCAC